MKTLSFHVHIRAEFYDHGQISARKAAVLLCRDINTILAKYDGSTGGAQIIGGARNLKVTDSDQAESRTARKRRKAVRRCQVCHRPERIRSIGGVRLSNLTPHSGLCAECINTALKS